MKKILMTIIITTMILSMVSCGKKANSNNKNQSTTKQEQKKEANENTVKDIILENFDGNKVSLLETIQNEGPVIIDFWATWCVPCKKELPHLAKLSEKYGVKVIAISEDTRRSRNAAKEYMAEQKFNFINFFDDKNKFQMAMGVKAIPGTFFVDKDGTIHYSHVGFEEGMEVEIEQHLKEFLEKVK